MPEAKPHIWPHTSQKCTWCSAKGTNTSVLLGGGHARGEFGVSGSIAVAAWDEEIRVRDTNTFLFGLVSVCMQGGLYFFLSVTAYMDDDS